MAFFFGKYPQWVRTTSFIVSQAFFLLYPMNQLETISSKTTVNSEFESLRGVMASQSRYYNNVNEEYLTALNARLRVVFTKLLLFPQNLFEYGKHRITEL